MPGDSCVACAGFCGIPLLILLIIVLSCQISVERVFANSGEEIGEFFKLILCLLVIKVSRPSA